MIRLANMPMPHVTTMAHSVLDMFRVKTITSELQPDASVHDAVLGHARVPTSNSATLAVCDWDFLFSAVLMRLENSVKDGPCNAPDLAKPDCRINVQTVVIECVDSMRQLHHALRQERQLQQS